MAKAKNWKSTERALAKRLGGERVPVSGRTRGSSPDISHSHYGIEVKERKTLPAWLHSAMDQAVKSAATYFRKSGNNQLPIVILHETGKHHSNDFVIIRFQDLEELLALEVVEE